MKTDRSHTRLYLLAVLALGIYPACRCSRPQTTGLHPVFAQARGQVFAIGGQQAGVQGTAFLVQHRGGRYLLASYHVVAKLEAPFVQSADQERFADLPVLAIDREADLVVLDATGLPTQLPGLRCRTATATSEAVFLLGYPAMGWGSVRINFAAGYISDSSYQAPSLTGRSSLAYIQATTPINLGHSGSPLLNARAEVLGVIEWRYEPDTQIQGGNYAVPIQYALNLIDRLQKGGAPIELHPSVGRTCAADADCGGLDFCLDGRCDVLRRPGQRCRIDEDCFLPYVCDRARCTPLRGQGGLCSADYLCEPPLVCVLGTCRQVGLAGDGCAIDSDCNWPMVCQRGSCQRGTERPPERQAACPAPAR